MLDQPGMNGFQIVFRALGQPYLEPLIRHQREVAFDRSSSTTVRAGLALPAAMS